MPGKVNCVFTKALIPFGSIMSVGRQYVERAWWIAAFPGGCLFLLVFSVNVLGDWLRDRLDPQARVR